MTSSKTAYAQHHLHHLLCQHAPIHLQPFLHNLLQILQQANDQGHTALPLNAHQQQWLEQHQDDLSVLITLEKPDTLAIHTPLVWSPFYLQWHKHWVAEQTLALDLVPRSQQCASHATQQERQQLLDHYFPLSKHWSDHGNDSASTEQHTDWQRLAAEVAIKQRFCLISGGPGTGKTTTVAALLACLLTLNPSWRFALAAPTGKAANRLQLALQQALSSLPVPEHIRPLIPTQARTLHRLLGVRPFQIRFVHNAQHPLPYDGIIVDEASMIDSQLMAQLMQALPSHGRLILLGDSDQLASVAAGDVLNQLGIAFPHHRVTLQHTHRFNQHIQRFASAINQSQTEDAWQQLQQGHSFIHIPPQTDEILARCMVDFSPYQHSVQRWLDQQQTHPDRDTPSAVFEAFDHFRCLCAQRQGEWGVDAINQALQQWWQTHIHTDIGLPWMVTQNDPQLDVFNGDIGIALPDEQGQLRLWFPSLSHDSSTGDTTAKPHYRGILPAHIPHRQLAFAMTIHKSQGSEFQQVGIVLTDHIADHTTDENTTGILFNRQLLYTAITRAKQAGWIATSQSVFERSCQSQHRISSLAHQCQRLQDQSL